MKKATKEIHIYVPLDLYPRLQEKAQDNDRSINREVITAIREHCKDEKEETK